MNALNDRVFFWAHPDRLTKLLNARLYRDSLHDVLVLDTAELIEMHEDRIRLWGLSTGATIFPKAPARGSDTSMRISAFPFDERRRARKALLGNVVEVCVLDGCMMSTTSLPESSAAEGARWSRRCTNGDHSDRSRLGGGLSRVFLRGLLPLAGERRVEPVEARPHESA